MYEFLANTVMVMHAVLILLVFGGMFISIFLKRFRPVESFTLLTAVIIWSLYGGCPLTFLKNYLRIQAHSPIPLTKIGFIAYYAKQWLGVTATNRTVEITTYVIAILFLFTSLEWFSYKNLKKFLQTKF